MLNRPRTWATIDLGAVKSNFERVKVRVGERVRVMGVVKADAYGHGAVQVSRVLEQSGVDMLGVGDSSEAIELREEGISLPIVILGAICGREIEEVVHYDISPTLHSVGRVKEIADEARKQQKRLGVHMMVDTGMGRLGVRPDSAAKLAEAILDEETLELKGLATHFAMSQARDKTFSREQLDRFLRVQRSLKRRRVHIPYVHAANSAAVFGIEEAHFNLVRPGIALYGMDPGNFSELGVQTDSALSLKTQIVFLKGVQPGTPVGYGCTYRAYRPTKIATCPIGYNDGFPYGVHTRNDVIVRGRRAPVVGRVTMDYIMVDVGHIGDVEVGDEVTIIGADGAVSITAEEVSVKKGTIPYEITCSLGKRVKRIYTDASAGTERIEDRKRA